jgi:ADP-ribose pyrophosphatase YjhB (NUDIX family)
MMLVSARNRLELRFLGDKSPRLDRICFDSASGERLVSVRGDAAVSDPRARPRFDWSNALKAFCILAVRHACSGGQSYDVPLQGMRGTAAASLNDALTKRPNWIRDLFGSDSGDRPRLCTIVRRRNADFKTRNEPVSLWIQSTQLSPDDTNVFLDNWPITARQELMNLAKLIQDEWTTRDATRRRAGMRRGTVGVFGVALKSDKEGMKILVNVRNDQKEQLDLAGLSNDSTVLIVDLPGGRWLTSDASEEEALRREIREETHCESEIIDGSRVGPFKKSLPNSRAFDYCFAWEVRLIGTPEPSDEATEHRWVKWEDLVAEIEVRLPGTLGANGRMGQMIQAILNSVVHRQRPRRVRMVKTGRKARQRRS